MKERQFQVLTDKYSNWNSAAGYIMVQPLWKLLSSLIKLHIHLPCDPAIPLTAKFVLIALNWKPKSLPMEEWINKLWYIHRINKPCDSYQ